MKNVISIIVTYNGLGDIEKCIKSVQGESSIVVIDNASTDGTSDFVSNNFPDIKLIALNENIGFGKANNIGISYALEKKYEYIFFINQDAYLQQNGICNLVKSCDPVYGLISPIHYNFDGSSFDKTFLQVAPRSLLNDLFFNKHLGKVYMTDFINAAGWLIPSSVLKTIGGFDPLFFVYGEDVNFIQRLKFHEFKIGICPTVGLYHNSSNNFYSLLKKKDKPGWFIRSMLYQNLANVNTMSLFKLFKFKFYIYRKLMLSLVKIETDSLSKYIKILKYSNFRKVFYSLRKNKTKGPHYIP